MSELIVMRTFLKLKYNYQHAESTHNNAIVHYEKHVCIIKLLTSGVRLYLHSKNEETQHACNFMGYPLVKIGEDRFTIQRDT